MDNLLWSLARGDVLANLEELHGMDYSGSDQATLQIKQLLSVGYNWEALA